ncbi:MAG: YegS/Rv2252/BmrU family lipid kinase [Ruminococcaceae bacterium]|nr:YegS/Rv2252/BmrU family lipid kinase [Oscillospiraceae bacterium]
MAKKLLLIFNAYSGKGSIKTHLWEVIDILTKDGYEVHAYSTQQKGDATRIVERIGRRYHVITACGGDGTLNEVVCGAMTLTKRPFIAYIPTGTTNDFATCIGLPKNIKKAAQSITRAVPLSCDIGSFNGNYYTYVSAFGAFTEVSYKTPRQSKNTIGHLAYVFEGMKSLSNIKPYDVTVETESEKIEGKFILGMITNSNYIGGYENVLLKDFSINDGLFEVILIRNPNNPLDLQMILNSIISRKPDPRHVKIFKASKIKISSEEEIPWTLDGEFGGSHKEANIEIIPNAITLLKSYE